MVSAVFPVLVAAIFSMIVFYGQFQHFDSSDLPTIAKLLTIVISYLVTDTVVRTINHHKTIQKIDKTTEKIGEESKKVLSLIGSSFSVTHVGRDNTANELVSEKIITGARQVKNTVVASSNIDFVGRESHEKEVAEVYKKMLNRNDANNWHDVTSYNLKKLPRYQLIDDSDIKPGQFQKLILPDQSKVPIINFVIVEYPTLEKEVFFGWLYSDIIGASDVYQSSDNRLVSLFEDYFQALQYACK
jgi:hypothetical protein